jgi:hypothetical protein
LNNAWVNPCSIETISLLASSPLLQKALREKKTPKETGRPLLVALSLLAGTILTGLLSH